MYCLAFCQVIYYNKMMMMILCLKYFLDILVHFMPFFLFFWSVGLFCLCVCGLCGLMIDPDLIQSKWYAMV